MAGIPRMIRWRMPERPGRDGRGRAGRTSRAVTRFPLLRHPMRSPGRRAWRRPGRRVRRSCARSGVVFEWGGHPSTSALAKGQLGGVWPLLVSRRGSLSSNITPDPDQFRGWRLLRTPGRQLPRALRVANGRGLGRHTFCPVTLSCYASGNRENLPRRASQHSPTSARCPNWSWSRRTRPRCRRRRRPWRSSSCSP